jgi:hypothetical protein
VKVIDECYEPTIAKADKGVTGSYWVNIFNGIGFLIDWATGDMWYYPSHMQVITSKKADCEDKS